MFGNIYMYIPTINPIFCALVPRLCFLSVDEGKACRDFPARSSLVPTDGLFTHLEPKTTWPLNHVMKRGERARRLKIAQKWVRFMQVTNAPSLHTATKEIN